MRKPIKGFTKYDGNTTSLSINGIKAEKRIGVEQDIDLVLKILKLRTLGEPHEEVLLTTDKRFKHYKTNEERILFQD